jgi:hypothetical protein
MSSVVLQRVPLGFQWPTIDPFLFCVHHDDAYPAGNGSMGPAASLAGREIGSDFSGTDGWRMYHGDAVPGFPQHPHRGFETVTFVRRGLIDHSDSLGAAARYGQGDVQWLTAGAGIVHAEMFPLLETEQPNPTELFQIWLNLPRADKMADPYFAMLWDGDIPRIPVTGANGGSGTITVVAGELEGVTPPSPPPSSWASQPHSDVAIWHIRLDAGTDWVLPAARTADAVRVLYLFGGASLAIGGEEVTANMGAVLASDRDVALVAGSDVECLVLQGTPIGEPVVQHGPFVMNDRAGIERAFADYQATGFGGWPWPEDGPVHGHDRARFARRPDGTLETPVDDQSSAMAG